MVDRQRLLGAASLLLLVLGAEEQAPSQEERPIHERIDLPSIAACGGCHQEVAREWSASLHARAWTNANARSATRDFERKSCRPCHSPRSIFETGLDAPPAYRDRMVRNVPLHRLVAEGWEHR